MANRVSPERRLLMDLLAQGPIQRSEAEARMAEVVSNHRGLTAAISRVRRENIVAPYRSHDQLIRSGKQQKVWNAIHNCRRQGVAVQFLGDDGQKWLRQP
jgi:hypothetical protein